MKSRIFYVSHLTKRWAFKGAEQVIRALSGNAISADTKIIIKYKKGKK